MPISLFDLFINFVEAITAVFFLTRYFRMKTSFNAVYFIIWVLYLVVGVTVMNVYLGYEKYFMLLIPLWAYFPWLLVFAEGSVIEKGYISIFTVQLLALVGILVVIITSLIMYGTVDTSKVLQNYYEISTLINKFVFLIVSLIIAKERRKLKSSLQFSVLIGFAAFSIVALLIYISLEDILYLNYVNLMDVTIALVGLLLLVIAVFIVFFKMQVTNEKNLENELKLQALDYQKGLNEMAIEVNRETGRIQHDLKHFLSHIDFLLREKRYSEAIDAVQAHSKNSELNNKVILTSNEIINYVLNTKNGVASERGLSMRFVLNFCHELLINDVDLVILLGNAIDNAIENCVGKTIEVRIEDKNEYLHITVSNRIKNSVLENNENLETTKESKGHGYGVKSIKEIVKRYDGTVDFYEDNNRFYCSILIK
ncbi:sensor histidine kinase [Breznakia pachnodae]|uniref:Signal transduction histidine kinase n=1 Tax=Breznakia pachnodae TaxID=265178 RepID=A0ABU0E173_9FIRM|nr:sensor histidine kinase [Breznakia pachnodae]MDQ0360628.1 signal transduction histidine kinase [Breznakia pachnodae]